MRRQQITRFSIGLAFAVLLLALGFVRYKNAYPMSFGNRPTRPAPQQLAGALAPANGDLPTYSTNAWGMTVERSLSATEKTKAAVSEFTQRVSRTGLRLTVHGDLDITVYSGKSKVISANTDDTHFGLHYRGDEKAAVDTMQKRGEDENGIPRDPWSVITAAGVKSEQLAAWADPERYPIQAALDDVQSKVLALVEAMDVGGTNRYLLESASRLQMGAYDLPFFRFMFTTHEFYGQSARINREDLEVVVRVGGKDLQPGQAELVCYSDGGYVWRRRESSKTKPQPPVPRISSP